MRRLLMSSAIAKDPTVLSAEEKRPNSAGPGLLFMVTNTSTPKITHANKPNTPQRKQITR